MPVPQVRLLPLQAMELLRAGDVLEPHPAWSVAGVAGFEPLELRPLVVVKDALRGRVCGTSFSQDVRRMGLG